MARVTLLLLAALALTLAACGDDDGGSASGSAGTPRPKLACANVKAPAPRDDGGQREPTARLDPAATYDVEIATSCGDFTIRVDPKAAPRTTASFVSLVRNGFYDETVFHRIVPGFVIQGGDPTATGSGTPGYTTRDVPASDTVYTRAVVAMGKAGNEPPGTAGSQFFVVTAPDAGLPPEYAPLGKVVKGLAVVELIGRQGDPASGGSGTPKRPVVLEQATLAEQ